MYANLMGFVVAAFVLLTALSGAQSVASAPSTAQDAAAKTRLAVSGGPVGSISTSPLKLSPSFAPDIHDYVLRCQAGTNVFQLTLTAAPGQAITVGSEHGASAVVPEAVGENQAVVVSSPGPAGPGSRSSYSIRCLPHDFPALDVTDSGQAPPGWYLTGNFFGVAGSGAYVMILDNHGTPVWYEPAPQGAVNVTPLPNEGVAWASNADVPFSIDPAAAYAVFNFQSQSTGRLTAPVPPTEFHELDVLPQGGYMMLASPLRAGVDLTSIGLGSKATIVDCVIERVDPTGRLVWQWRASDHIAFAESTQHITLQVNGVTVQDIYHCNSVDTDPQTGNVLLSSRHTDAVFMIDPKTNKIVWKVGGTPFNHDGAQILRVTGDPEISFYGQHDARFQPNGDISLYDNHSWGTNQAARGVEYHLDLRAGTAQLVWSLASTDGGSSMATGSFRRLDGGSDNVIAWGFKQDTLFTEVDASGHLLLNVTFPNGEVAYRVIKTPLSAFNADLLRSSVGLPTTSSTTLPQVAFVSTPIGPAKTDRTVDITGKGFSDVTGVWFGGRLASSFSIISDNLIVATAPPGAGTVGVTVTVGDARSVLVSNVLSADDSDFPTGDDSWESLQNSTLEPTDLYSKTGQYSLQVAPVAPGVLSANSGPSPVPSDVRVVGSAWVLTPSASQSVRGFISFYDSSDSLISTAKGPAVTTSTNDWTAVKASATTPSGTATARVGVEVDSASDPVYVDAATLSGADRYTYATSTTTAITTSELRAGLVGFAGLLLGIGTVVAIRRRPRRRSERSDH